MVRLQWPTVVMAAMRRPEGRQYQEELGGIFTTAAHIYGPIAVGYCCYSHYPVAPALMCEGFRISENCVHGNFIIAKFE